MKNWTVKEALAVVAAGNDIEAIKELAKHFPNFFLCAAKGDFAGIANAMPDKWTLRTLEKGFGAQEDEEVEGEEATEAPCTVEAEEAEMDLSAMSTKELMKLCDKRGIKVPHYGKNKQFYLDALTGGGEAEAEAEEAEEAAESEAPANPYEGKTAMELFKLCKQRKIKAEAKQKAKYYVELLTAADQAVEAESEEAAEEWGDEEAEEVEEKPAKKSKGGKKAKSAKKEKEAPKAEPEDDEDDWDI